MLSDSLAGLVDTAGLLPATFLISTAGAVVSTVPLVPVTVVSFWEAILLAVGTGLLCMIGVALCPQEDDGRG